MTTISNEIKTEIAVKMVLLDAIEKGHTNLAEVSEYMKSEIFAAAVTNYKLLLDTF